MATTFSPPLNPSDPVPTGAVEWLPRLHAGYLYTQDRQYYLYADKKTKRLRDATKYIFELAAVPETDGVAVFVEGVPFSSFEVVGNELHLMATDEESFASFYDLVSYDLSQFGFLLHGFAFGPSNQVRIEYETLVWQGTGTSNVEPTGNTFRTASVSETFRIKEALRIDYQLTKPRDVVIPTGITLASNTLAAPTGFTPDLPVGDAPIVLSDDRYEYTDERGFQTEYSVDPNTAELKFNTGRNYLQNPAFEVVATGEGFSSPNYEYPLEWWSTDVLTITSHTGDPYYGQRCQQLDSTGQMLQTIENLDPREPWTFSLWAREGTGSLYINFLDANELYFNTDGSLSATAQPDLTFNSHFIQFTGDSSEWRRYSLTFGPTDTTQCAATGTYAAIPTGAVSAEVKIARDAGLLCVDAVAAEQAYEPSDFEPLDPNITIEYEGSTKRYWQPDRLRAAPLELNVLDINPLRNPVPGGFLFVEEFSAVEDYKLGIGDFVAGDSTAHTGILQVTGEVGVNVGRTHLPYAKVSGLHKLVPRNKFHLDNPAIIDDISDLTIDNGTPDPVPATIEWVPRDGIRASGLVPELVVIPDSRINVRLDALVFDQFSNPAYTYSALATVASGALTPGDPTTSHQGQLSLTYTPPTVWPSGNLGAIDTITLGIHNITETLNVYGYRPAGLDLDSYLTQ